VTDPVIISDPLRVPITAERRIDGGVVVRGQFRSILALSQTELTRLAKFARNKPTLQRSPTAPKTPLSALQSDDLTFSG
jgi:hypothetical protein